MHASDRDLDRRPPGAPHVTVVIPCFNAAEYVGEALDSVFAQGRDDLQVVVVNDGSSDADELRRVLDHYGARVELIDRPHEGLASTRNAGIDAARGDVIALLDADDKWKPGLLDAQLRLLQESGADLVYCDAELCGDAEFAGRRFMDRYPSSGEVTAAALLLKKCVVVMSTVVARTQALRDAGGFDLAVPFCEDLDLWVRMSLAGAKFAYQREPLALRRLHGSNMSNDGRSMVEWVLRIIERYHDVANLTVKDHRRLRRRERQLRARLHESTARLALGADEPVQASESLWLAFHMERTPWRLLAATSLSVFPTLAMKFIWMRRSSGPTRGSMSSGDTAGPP